MNISHWEEFHKVVVHVVRNFDSTWTSRWTWQIRRQLPVLEPVTPRNKDDHVGRREGLQKLDSLEYNDQQQQQQQ